MCSNTRLPWGKKSLSCRPHPEPPKKWFIALHRVLICRVDEGFTALSRGRVYETLSNHLDQERCAGDMIKKTTFAQSRALWLAGRRERMVGGCVRGSLPLFSPTNWYSITGVHRRERLILPTWLIHASHDRFPLQCDAYLCIIDEIAEGQFSWLLGYMSVVGWARRWIVTAVSEAWKHWPVVAWTQSSLLQCDEQLICIPIDRQVEATTLSSGECPFHSSIFCSIYMPSHYWFLRHLMHFTGRGIYGALSGGSVCFFPARTMGG